MVCKFVLNNIGFFRSGINIFSNFFVVPQPFGCQKKNNVLNRSKRCNRTTSAIVFYFLDNNILIFERQQIMDYFKKKINPYSKS